MPPDSSKSPELDASSIEELLYDWNGSERPRFEPGLVDETLRDGLQSASAVDPPIALKLGLLQRAAELGIDCFALGFPASRRRQFDDALELAKAVSRERLRLEVCCAARTLVSDIVPIAEIAQRSGVRVQVGMFIGSSAIRRRAEGWSLDQVLRFSEEAVGFAVKEGLEVLYVTEDSTRSAPQILERLHATAIRAGALRVCVADTVGHATPEGAFRVVRFVRESLDRIDSRVRIDWHGHRDRGLDVACCLSAYRAGAHRCHGTALGIGERSGNAPIEQLLVNLHLLGWRRFDLARLPEYVQKAAEALGFEIPAHQPVVGRDAFRTATGAHAAAVSKALALGDAWMADRVFSGVPAQLVGRDQEVEVGPASGEANVVAWLTERGIQPDVSMVGALLARAKRADAILPEQELLELIPSNARRVSK